MPRLYDRYGHTQPARTCSTPACSGTTKAINGRCDTCAARLRRFGDCLQTLPTTAEMDKAIRRIEEARGRLKLLDVTALEARWTMLADDCRAKATSTFKDHHRLSYSGWEREGAQMVRDMAEQISFTRALDLLGAIQLLQMERGFFRSDEALACCTVELMRRTSRVGCKVMAMSVHRGTIARSYRRELGKDSRLATARLLNMGLGAAAAALAKRAAAQAGEAKKVQTDYWASVRAIESAASA
jgi:hypothetical protein